jgi:hypothetical protein
MYQQILAVVDGPLHVQAARDAIAFAPACTATLSVVEATFQPVPAYCRCRA